jgi:hypothetical protein
MRSLGLALSICIAVSSVGCLPLKKQQANAPDLKGYDGDQLAEYESKNGTELLPLYSSLSMASQGSERRLVKIAMFFAYDHVDNSDLDSAGGVVSLKPEVDVTKLDPWSTNADKDYAASAFAQILTWLVDGNDPFLHPLVEGAKDKMVERILQGPISHSVKLIGKGPGLASKGVPMNYEILLHLGVAGSADFAAAFGEAMATHNIAMLNGHFFAEDAEAAATASANADSADPRFRDWSESDANFDNFWSRQKSEIYGPAMDRFEKLAPSSGLNYRIAVFNGCGSEKIENLVLESAQRVNASNIELVGMRGFSNYRHFPGQISRFLSSLERGEKWTQVIKSFEFDDAGTTQSMRNFRRTPKVGNSSPVYRSVKVGADGEAQANSKADLQSDLRAN